MRHAAKLGITFDYYSLGYGNQQRALKPDPIKKAESLTKADKHISLYADGTPNMLTLGFSGHDSFTLELDRPQLDGVVDWLIALLEDRADRVRNVGLEIQPSGEHGARAWFEHHERETINPFGLWSNAAAWVVMLEPEWATRLSPARWEKHLPHEPALAEFFFRDLGKNARLVGMHADPLATPTLAEHQALARVVHRMVVDIIEEQHGYRWRELADEVLAPMLAELGLDKTTKDATLWPGVEYGSDDRRRRCVLALKTPFTTPQLVLKLECTSSSYSYYTRDLVSGPATSRAELVSLLERGAAVAIAERGWFDNPAPPPKKRRR